MRPKVLSRWLVAGFGAVGGCALGACSHSQLEVAGDGGGAEAAVVDGSAPEEGASGASDAAASDAAIEGGGTCHPMSALGFQPPAAYFGPISVSAACAGFDGEGGLLSGYGDSCLGHSATYAVCAGFSPPDAAGAADCYRCLVSPGQPDGTSYGVVIEGTVPVVNYFGCIQALDPTDAGVSCAHAVQDAVECFDYVCRAACPPIIDEVSLSAYNHCTDEARRGGCIGYTLGAEECVLREPGDGGTSVATVCFGGVTEEDHYLTTARYFCDGRRGPGG